MTAIESLLGDAARREREAAISGPRDRAELLRLAGRDRRLAGQLQAEQRIRAGEAFEEACALAARLYADGAVTTEADAEVERLFALLEGAS